MFSSSSPSLPFIFSGLSYVPYKDKGNYEVVVSESETKAALEQIKGGIILIKASRGCHFEQYVSYVAGRFGGQDAL